MSEIAGIAAAVQREQHNVLQAQTEGDREVALMRYSRVLLMLAAYQIINKVAVQTRAEGHGVQCSVEALTEFANSYMGGMTANGVRSSPGEKLTGI